MAITHTCSFPGCRVPVDARRICCGHHWHLLPARIQAGIQERLRGWGSAAEARSFLLSYVRTSKTEGKNSYDRIQH